MSVIDDLLASNARYAAEFPGSPSAQPALRLAVVACMDARIEVEAVLGLRAGDAHIIRNAGGSITEDGIRSLTISQRLLGTREIILIHHTGCGMQTISDDEFRASLQQETGIRPPWAAEAFSDVDEDVRQSVRRIKASPFIPYTGAVRGFVLDVETGRLREVAA